MDNIATASDFIKRFGNCGTTTGNCQVEGPYTGLLRFIRFSRAKPQPCTPASRPVRFGQCTYDFRDEAHKILSSVVDRSTTSAENASLSNVGRQQLRMPQYGYRMNWRKAS
jgi:hypothetical protein